MTCIVKFTILFLAVFLFYKKTMYCACPCIPNFGKAKFNIYTVAIPWPHNSFRRSNGCITFRISQLDNKYYFLRYADRASQYIYLSN